MTNFDYLKKEPKFDTFSVVAITAEKILYIDPTSCILNCRRAMEFAIKWLYSVDKDLKMPYQETLVSLMSTEEFKDILGEDLLTRLVLIRKMGNNAAHTTNKLTEDDAALCLENLHIFFDFISYCYSDNYEEHSFDKSLLTETEEELPKKKFPDVDMEALLAENAALKEELTSRRKEQVESYVPKPLELSEYKTRKIYIDTMLMDAGWKEGSDWINEVELSGMPNKSELGYADYVLYDNAHVPLAIIEAKKTCVDVSQGRQQAKLYADILEKKYKRRPCIFLTNGFETRESLMDSIRKERSPTFALKQI